MWLIFSTKQEGTNYDENFSNSKNNIYNKLSPEAIWPYSKAKKVWNLLFCSGQIWLDPETMEIVLGWIEEQTKRVIRNISWVLKENNLSLKDVVKTTIYLKNIENFEIVNSIYKNYFVLKPARSTVEVSKLPKNAQIEIEVIAEIK
jgi:2-iminobutanoate/2-iminopropanoate deaminase